MGPRISCNACGLGYSLGESRPVDFKIKKVTGGDGPGSVVAPSVVTYCKHCAPPGFLGGRKEAR